MKPDITIMHYINIHIKNSKIYYKISIKKFYGGIYQMFLFIQIKEWNIVWSGTMILLLWYICVYPILIFDIISYFIYFVKEI